MLRYISLQLLVLGVIPLLILIWNHLPLSITLQLFWSDYCSKDNIVRDSIELSHDIKFIILLETDIYPLQTQNIIKNSINQFLTHIETITGNGKTTKIKSSTYINQYIQWKQYSQLNAYNTNTKINSSFSYFLQSDFNSYKLSFEPILHSLQALPYNPYIITIYYIFYIPDQTSSHSSNEHISPLYILSTDPTSIDSLQKGQIYDGFLDENQRISFQIINNILPSSSTTYDTHITKAKCVDKIVQQMYINWNKLILPPPSSTPTKSPYVLYKGYAGAGIGIDRLPLGQVMISIAPFWVPVIMSLIKGLRRG